MDTTEIIWRPIVGWPYEVSNHGAVRHAATKLERALRISRYATVQLWDHGETQAFLVHRLVATAFLPPDNRRTVNHKNGVKTDNRVENLEWATYVEQQRHAYETGLRVIKDLQHGTFSGYNHSGCRCVACNEANTHTKRRQRAAQKARLQNAA